LKQTVGTNKVVSGASCSPESVSRDASLGTVVFTGTTHTGSEPTHRRNEQMNLDWKFLTHLFAMGRARAEEWLNDNFKLLGVETTLDLHSRYL
jgi:hypothetical protein